MNDETPEQRVAREIENDIKGALKAINKNVKMGKDLTEHLRELLIMQECKHNWVDTGSCVMSVSECTKCGREDMV